VLWRVEFVVAARGVEVDPVELFTRFVPEMSQTGYRPENIPNGWMKRCCGRVVVPICEQAKRDLFVMLAHAQNRRSSIATVFLASLVLCCGCSEGKRPFRMVQFCLAGNSDAMELKREVSSIARSEGMKLNDGSDAAERGLEATHAPADTRQQPVIHVGVEGSDGLGLMVASIGLPSFQVVLGFSEGADRLKARAFADRVVKRLSQRWHLKTVPAGTGALPLKDCD